ncbi:magnesium transporter NIPA-domain-containing protein [Absidia repens]|uniref:Magnesium transporter NIPA-domain-containing protein n=1 Tax=Absidia repens TaxID=90262 RepID=A0A1X2ILQ4_9FUNG|nr:magnesium transporter NIPA-domain-containing protein [Absidia repens]
MNSKQHYIRLLAALLQLEVVNSTPVVNDPIAISYKNTYQLMHIGLLIGSSFVFKKKGLLESTEKAGGVAGEGYHYLRSVMWWAGMILMILGELCNFVAYAFAPAVLVTPLGALSVVVSAILSSIFLKERLTFHGKVGCLQCIIGAVMIVLHAPTNIASDSSVEGFKKLVITVGFLVYAGIVLIISLVLIFYCGPRWGKKNMLVYISICSVIGSISVVFTQGFGSAIVYSIGVENQFTNWFIYIMLLILVFTLVLEIVYLNKALNLYNTALVTPTYYVIFTTMTIVSSTILFQGFNASGTDIASCVMGFLCICSGVALLHHSSATPNNSNNRVLEDGDDDDDDLEKRKTTIAMSDRTISSRFNTMRRKSSNLFSLFDRDSKTELSDYHQQDNRHLGENTPGPDEFFSAPFSGITRYASTTRSQSMRLRQNSLHRQQQQLLQPLRNATAPTEPDHIHSDAYRTQHDGEADEKVLWYPQGSDLHSIKEVDKPLLSTSSLTVATENGPHEEKHDYETIAMTASPQTSTPTSFQQSSRRDQNELNPIQSLRLGIIGKKNHDSDSDDDRKGLVDH